MEQIFLHQSSEGQKSTREWKLHSGSGDLVFKGLARGLLG